MAQRVQLSTAALHHAQVYHLPGGVQSPGADGAGVHKAGQVLSMLSRVEACGLEKAGNKDEKLLPGEEPVRAEGAVLIAQGQSRRRMIWRRWGSLVSGKAFHREERAPHRCNVRKPAPPGRTFPTG